MLDLIVEFIKENHPTYSQLREHFASSSKESFDYFLNTLSEQGTILKIKANYYLSKELNLIPATITSIKPKFAFATISEDEDGYISLKNLKKAFLNDRVLLKLISLPRQKKEYEVMYITKRSNQTVVGEVDIIGNKTYLIVDKIAPKNFLFMVTKGGENLQKGTIAQGKIIDVKYSYAEVEIIKDLGNKLDIGMDITRIILSNGAPLYFPSEVMDQVANIPNHVLEEEKVSRVDFTDRMIVTIDGDDAKDFDDAVEAHFFQDHYEVGVHIADVAHYVSHGSPLDVEALNRATSLYVQDRVVPMLPFQLSNGICSLNPHEERLVTSCLFKVGLDGRVYDTKICKGVIKSYARLTYNYVNNFLNVERKIKEETDSFTPLEKMLIDLYDVSALIRKKRRQAGSLELESVELKFKINSQGEPYDVEKRKQDVGELLIEDLMIKANEIVASTIEKMKLPMVFRIHEKPHAKRLEAFKKISEAKGYPCHIDSLNCIPRDVARYLNTIDNVDDKEILSSLLLRCLAKAKYSIQNKKHFGLASTSYTHFTSPIRRYPDLIVHRLIDRYIISNDVEYNADFKTMLSLRAELSSSRERRALNIERSTDSLLSCKLMKPYIGEEYQGKVVSMVDKGLFIQLENGIEGMLPFENIKGDYFIFNEDMMIAKGKQKGNVYHLGDKVDVILEDVDIQKSQITFKLKQENNRKERSRYIYYGE